MINGINSIAAASNTVAKTNNVNINNGSGSSFSTILKQSLETVNKAQIESDKLTNAFISGKPVELHNVMIASEKAGILLQTTIEVRNKAIEAYQEMMRMQV
ncbi:flagellar hook-basal body complex protein FliE [Bacillus kexueae]|uniref:flagellar hook-basal body complex protein FliE n=1 Tax=Aeribacillus kexueae TaxID=2078952 RepID=UPI001FAEA3C2|nr:flagellar hook-basal body complex protein FliE [Bacillus kexueae]